MVLWSDWLVLCDYGFSVSALWCSLATPTILLGFLLPWMWGISSRLHKQSVATAPYLGRGVSLTATRPDLEHGVAPLGPPAPAQQLLLGGGVAPFCHCPWPRAWGISSQPPLTLDVGKLLLAAAPVLSQPGALCRYPWIWVRASRWSVKAGVLS